MSAARAMRGIVGRDPLLPSSTAEQTMGMPEADLRRRWTREEVVALIDEERAWPRYELIAGELLVTSAPREWSEVTRLLPAAEVL